MTINFDFIKQYEKYSAMLKVSRDDKELYPMSIFLDFPVVITDLSGAKKKCRYDSVKKDGDTLEGGIQFEDFYGNQFIIMDTWRASEACYRLDRKVECVHVQKTTGIRLTSEFRCRGDKELTFDDYQFIIPGAFYNKNDTDEDGMEDYLGTYSQDYKDDRNPSLSVTSYARNSKMFFSLLRADIPQKDETITRKQINERHFIHHTDIGSLGIAPSEYHSAEIIMRCDYPFYERNSFCLNVDGSEWAAYKEIKEPMTYGMSYILLFGEADNLTAASWQTTELQIHRLLKKKIELPFTLKEARQYRREMINNSFREFAEKKGKPAGYFVHFSPRREYGEQYLLEYGFTGAQTLLAYDMLYASWEKGTVQNDQEIKFRSGALKTLDYFVDCCIEESGLPIGIYNVDKEEVVYWWTGILFPFQYSNDRKELEKYLGSQVVGALMSIADELGKVKGNYCRSMTDAMYYLMKAYQVEAENGCEHLKWRDAVYKFCDKLVEMQNPNGSWNRGYGMDGQPLTNPEEWFGASEKEQGAGAIFPIPLLVEVYRQTKENKYMISAEKAARFILSNYVENVMYMGGINDTSHKKSIKIDAASVMFVMRSLLVLYEENPDPGYLKGALDAAKILVSWTYLWDVPFDRATLLGQHGFKTTGWAVCDAIPAGSYVDCSFQEVVPELLRIAEYCNEKDLEKIAEAVTYGMQFGLSTPKDMWGYSMKGVQCEGYMTSLWLADTEYKEFSGAAAKNKGDDNDTCNGFVNGMTLLNLDYQQKVYNQLM